MDPPSLPVRQRCGLALASCILGVVAYILCLGPLAGIPAIICGHIAQARIRRSGGLLNGNGLAIAGLVMGYTSFVMIFFIGMLAAIAVPNFVRARAAAQQAACVANLKVLEAAKAIWALEYKKKPTDTPTDNDLFGEGKSIREKPACPAGGTYTLNTLQESPRCSVHGELKNGVLNSPDLNR